MLLCRAPRRLDWYGISDHAAQYSETIQSAPSAAGDAAEPGRTRVGLALRWRRHHLRRRSIAVAATGAADRDRAQVRRLLHRLPQRQADRAPAVGSGYAA